MPFVILFSMSFLTDINLGLRYVLAILPYLFISRGQARPLDARAFRIAEMGDDDARRRCAGLDDRRLGLDLPGLSCLLQLGLGRSGRKSRPA